MKSPLLMPACAAMLIALAACSHGPSGGAQATPPPVTAASPPAGPPISPPPAPSADQRLGLALDHLGAKRGPRGEILTLADDEFRGHAKLQAGASDKLKQLATMLQDYPKAELIVEGYTDSRGNEHRNEKLSLERADMVKQALITDGLDGTRIRTRGLGPADPIGDNATKSGRDKNRRVELVLSDSEGQFATTKDQSKTG